MPLDYSEFRPFLAGLNMPEAQENELMDFVWTMMKGFVDRAWGLDATQLCLAEQSSELREVKFAETDEDDLESKLTLKDLFKIAGRKRG